jgi:hypothetical protein
MLTAPRIVMIKDIEIIEMVICPTKCHQKSLVKVGKHSIGGAGESPRNAWVGNESGK